MDRTISLRELRRYAKKTQVEAARLVETTQPELSRFERRDDFLLSTLRRYVAALGGSLELAVSFGSSSFRLVPDAAAADEADDDEVADAVAALAALPAWLPPLVARRSPAQLAARVAGCGRYSLAEHVCHLCDVEIGRYAARLERVLAEDEPWLPDHHADPGAARLDPGRSMAPALHGLVHARRRHVRVLRGLRPEAFRRGAVLEGVGRLTLAALVLRWSSHDLGHRLEIERLSDATAAAPARADR